MQLVIAGQRPAREDADAFRGMRWKCYVALNSDATYDYGEMNLAANGTLSYNAHMRNAIMRYIREAAS
jgi:membrane protease subunit (stomatin/prohibitin family)